MNPKLCCFLFMYFQVWIKTSFATRQVWTKFGSHWINVNKIQSILGGSDQIWSLNLVRRQLKLDYLGLVVKRFVFSSPFSFFSPWFFPSLHFFLFLKIFLHSPPLPHFIFFFLFFFPSIFSFFTYPPLFFPLLTFFHPLLSSPPFFLTLLLLFSPSVFSPLVDM